MAKTYGQFCGLARALDHVGDRWTLLVIRELLLGAASYSTLLATLTGIPTNLLGDRLRELEADGLVTREADLTDGRRVIYQLTALGQGLEPALFEMIRWGAHWMRAGPGDDRFDTRWAVLALRALLGGRTPEISGTVELRFDGGPLALESRNNMPLQVERGIATRRPDAIVDADATLLLALVAGHLTLTAAIRNGARVHGNRNLARAVLQT